MECRTLNNQPSNRHIFKVLGRLYSLIRFLFRKCVNAYKLTLIWIRLIVSKPEYIPKTRHIAVIVLK